jgi:hypothetical protein
MRDYEKTFAAERAKFAGKTRLSLRALLMITSYALFNARIVAESEIG